MGDGRAVEAARAAAAAALQAGALDRLQAAALVAMVEGDTDLAAIAAARRTLAGELSDATNQLLASAENVIRQLEDPGSPGLEVSDLAELVAHLGDRVAALARRRYEPGRAEAEGALFAPPDWKAGMASALHHLKEARDLIDDGMSADAAAFAVQAARDALGRAVSG